MAARRRDVAGHKERYGREHKQVRAAWALRVADGTVKCWRCRRVIKPTDDWHLGHADHDPSRHMGPEHAACNLGAAAQKLNSIKRGEFNASREW